MYILYRHCDNYICKKPWDTVVSVGFSVDSRIITHPIIINLAYWPIFISIINVNTVNSITLLCSKSDFKHCIKSIDTVFYIWKYCSFYWYSLIITILYTGWNNVYSWSYQSNRFIIWSILLFRSNSSSSSIDVDSC